MVMVQAEVAERLAAEPGAKEYGVPSVKARFYGRVRRFGMVSPTVFWPIPRVYSGLVRIDRYETSPWPTNEEFRSEVFELIDIAFAQRRKTSRNAFLEWAGSGNESASRLLAASIDPARRGETLAVADFVRLLQRTGEWMTRRPGAAARPLALSACVSYRNARVMSPMNSVQDSIAQFGILGHRLGHDRVEGVRDPRNLVRHPGRRAVQLCVGQPIGGVRHEWHCAGDQFDCGAGQRVFVGGRRRGVAEQDLGRRVGQRRLDVRRGPAWARRSGPSRAPRRNRSAPHRRPKSLWTQGCSMV